MMVDRRSVMRLLISPLTLLLLLGSSALSAAEYLDSMELTAMVSGKTAYCQHINRPSHGRTYFNPDGTMHGIRRGNKRPGSWYVEDDTLCTNWGRRPVCSRYQSDGGSGHYKFTLTGKRIVHIHQWHDRDKVERGALGGVAAE